MQDYFALLKEPRRPWLEEEKLKQTFHALSGEVHPDRFHNASETEKAEVQARYTELNAAYQCLREPKERLLHLLTLERGAKPADIQRIPNDTVDLFAEVGQLCQATDKFLNEKAAVTSPLLKVQFFEKGMEWNDKLAAVQGRVQQKREELYAQLRELNAVWEGTPTAEGPERQAMLPLARLEEIYRALSFVTRWNGQLQERIVKISF